ncbi:MAG TPA: PEP/pyruvate-binding domain-containing protein [Acidimicrobiia bacterium]|jgi:pyruvate,water dikinase|nr:PEP/pyruvate-binding domain-containing protein [Acidimicrobiia bacterium]
MTAPPLVWIEDLDPAHAGAVAGSKLSRLADLTRAGLTVPKGFAVTTAAYLDFCRSAGVGERIARHLEAVKDPGDSTGGESAAAAIRAVFEEAPMSEGLAGAIADAYGELCYRCVDLNIPTAVRSSATGEDSVVASCAGQYDTVLGVSGAEGVLAAVRRCWGSLFSARALLYRLARGLSHRDSPMAVGVLELVHARASGVAFSIHPVTGKRDRMVIEGSWGWGEAVVQGLVNPDHVEVGKTDRRILRHDVADKAMVSVFDYARGTVVEMEMPERFRRRPALDAEEIGGIVEAVLRIEELYGHPVDVEWVIDKHRRPGEPVTIVQTRPETVHATSDDAPKTPGWDPAAYAARYAFGHQG